MSKDSHHNRILNWIYDRLFEHYGPRGWWPAKTPFEVAIGAILTQNTNWTNVERTIRNLKEKDLLTPERLKELPLDRLANLIRPAGYYRLKAKRLKEFIKFLSSRYSGSMEEMFRTDPLRLRQELLGVNGIGLETADSILLYAGNVPIFVIDAYTKRILSRHRLIEEKATYTQVQNYFMDHLPEDHRLFNEFHALIVQLGKDICKKIPECELCPLKEIDEILEYQCDGCGRGLSRDEIHYVLKMELFAAPDIEIGKEDLIKDHRKEIERLIECMKDRDPKDLEDEVYVAYKLNLCSRCRNIFNQRVSSREFI